MSAYVSHYVAKYDRATVAKFAASLHGEGEPATLDTFYCTDSVGCVVNWLQEECAKRTIPGVPSRLQVGGSSYIEPRACGSAPPLFASLE